ncbi:MAG: NAD(P)-binding domain-containing protein [Oscillospiraceae bacterium]|nr:NAD(P)-binding domain-containing protein [Oscillospiraceae bacterium]
MRVGIIGFGDMGRSLTTGLIKGGVSKENIVIHDSSERAVKKAQAMNIPAMEIKDLVACSDAVIFTIPKKPFMEKDLSDCDFGGKLVISCMAEVTMAELKQRFDCQTVRVIPTLAAENGLSIVGVCFDGEPENKEQIKTMFSKVGTVIECAENELAPLTSLAACGLCYAAYILNSFINTAENLGFDRETGKDIVERTFNAAMELGDYELVIGRIAGRGGITIKGVNVMNEGNVHKTIDKAFKTAYGELVKGQ